MDEENGDEDLVLLIFAGKLTSEQKLTAGRDHTQRQ